MKFLVTGAGGQLGSQWCRYLNDRGYAHSGLRSSELDISDASAVEEVLDRFKPDVVINCAAYTRVDDAEREVRQAFLVNETGVRNLAIYCQAKGVRMVHYSTDYVFPGTREDQVNHPSGYAEDAETAPVNMYGESKLAGEKALVEGNPGSLLIRVSWLCGGGGPNFVRKMLQLAMEREEVAVVEDQTGTPAYASDVVDKTMQLLELNESGTYHVSSSGSLSWADFAEEIFRLSGNHTRVKRVSSSEYKTVASRPYFSLLSKEKIRKLGIEPVQWKQGLLRLLNEIRDEIS